MALYEITYRCGHTDTVEIKGINWFGRRKKKIAWYGTIDCPACRLAKVRREHDGLPALEGSDDEQVVRAADIREKILERLVGLEDHDARDEHGATKEQTTLVARTISWLKAQTSASWWIDHQRFSDAIDAAMQALVKQEDLHGHDSRYGVLSHGRQG